MTSKRNSRPTPTRRELLQVGLGGLAAVGFSGTIPSFVSDFARAAAPGAKGSQNVLVVVQLSGGNDGLNTVIPLGSDAYAKARPVIGIKDRLLRLDGELALNPGLAGFKELFDDGALAIVNGCGYPGPNRSHFRSTDIWHTADPKLSRSTGWLGHYLDHAVRGTDNPLRAINVGQQLPLALVADSAPVPSFQSLEDFRLKTDRANPADSARVEAAIRAAYQARGASPAHQYLSRQAMNAIVTAEQVQKMSGSYKADAEYPQKGLGPQLRLIAQFIAADMGTRVYYCQHGGFDTHATQVATHEAVLSHCATSIREFVKDLKAKRLDRKVAILCFSEFGRRVKQNDSNGTDHGAAAPVFVCGTGVRGGTYGTYPSLTDLDDGDLKYTTDFRRVYATLLERWLGADSQAVLGGTFESLPLL